MGKPPTEYVMPYSIQHNQCKASVLPSPPHPDHNPSLPFLVPLRNYQIRSHINKNNNNHNTTQTALFITNGQSNRRSADAPSDDRLSKFKPRKEGSSSSVTFTMTDGLE